MECNKKGKTLLTTLLLLAAATCFKVEAAEQNDGSQACRRVEFLGIKSTAQLNRAKSNSLTLPPAAMPMPQCCAAALAAAADKQMRSAFKAGRSPSEVGINFTASTVSNAPQTDIIPLNATGWVGEQQYILMSYQSLRSFSKKTGKPDGALETDAASFFNFSVNDVRIEYDRFSRRWLLSGEGPSPFSQTDTPTDIYLAVSSDSTITEHTKWFFYRFPNALIIPQISPSGSGFIDYHQLALDKEAVYISVDAFDSKQNFVGTTALVIKKSSLLSGNPFISVFPGILPGRDPDLAAFTPPADNFDNDPQFAYLIHASTPGFPSANSFHRLFLYRIAQPGSDTPIISGPIVLKVPSYCASANAPHKGNLFGAAGYLQTGLFGGLMAPHVRDHQLYACHPIQVNSQGVGGPDGDRVGVRWYQFDLTGDKTGLGQGKESAETRPVLVQFGTLFDEKTSASPKFYYIPSIMTNKHHDLVISGTVSGGKDFTNVFYATRSRDDRKGFLHRPKLLTFGKHRYNFGPLVNPSNGNIGQRWGDASSLAPDPVSDVDIWCTGEWAAVPDGWGVQVSQLLIEK